MDVIPGTRIPAHPARITCTCGQRALCNVTDCPKPWAVAYRRKIRRSWRDRAVGWVAALTMKRWQ